MKRRSKKAPSRAPQSWLALAVAGIVVLGGLSLWLVSRTDAPAQGVPQTTDIDSTFPEWLVSAPAKAQRAYTQAIIHHEELDYIPCYCGCEKIGHISVADCYINSIDTASGIAYDRHAVG